MRHDRTTPTPASIAGQWQIVTPAAGQVLRAWRVRTVTGRIYRVEEHEVEHPGPLAGAVVSERGHPLTCSCPRASVRHGRCAHSIHIAHAIGGRDVVAEMWAVHDRSTTSEES